MHLSHFDFCCGGQKELRPTSTAPSQSLPTPKCCVCSLKFMRNVSVYLVEVLSSLPQTKHLLFIRGCFGLSRKLKLEGNSSVRKKCLTRRLPVQIPKPAAIPGRELTLSICTMSQNTLTSTLFSTVRNSNIVIGTSTRCVYNNHNNVCRLVQLLRVITSKLLV